MKKGIELVCREANLECFRARAADTDVAIVEGVMGLYDGQDGKSESGSTAEMAKLLSAPVLLVLDCWALARSAAAVIRGYTTFDPALRFSGVVFNKVTFMSSTFETGKCTRRIVLNRKIIHWLYRLAALLIVSGLPTPC